MRKRLLPHLHMDSADPRLVAAHELTTRLTASVVTLFVSAVAVAVCAVTLADVGAIASDTAIVLIVGTGVFLGVTTLLIAGLSLLAPSPPRPGRPNWLTQQRLDQKRQLVLVPGMLLLTGAGVMMLSHAPRPFAPPLHDLSTDLVDPPPLEAARFPADTAALIRARYPALKALSVQQPPGACLARALASARQLGWEPSGSTGAAAASSSIFEARIASRLLIHDISDVVVRIRPGGEPHAATNASDEWANTSIVDVRSRSRDRTYDFGVNAALIDRFARKLLF